MRDPLPESRDRPGLSPGDVFVIGVGNAWRGDDAVGLEVVHRLRGKLPEGVHLRHSEGEPTRLLEDWYGAKALVLVDATNSGAEPAGTVRRIDLSAGEVPQALFRGSTHHFSLGDAIELARSMKRLPERSILYGIEATSFDTGSGLQPAVEAAVAPVAERVVSEVASLLGERA
ncbi:MAG: hydrogenase maturation protease [Gaiellaceae bacterium]